MRGQLAIFEFTSASISRRIYVRGISVQVIHLKSELINKNFALRLVFKERLRGTQNSLFLTLKEIGMVLLICVYFWMSEDV